jgi:hypothetical protein
MNKFRLVAPENKQAKRSSGVVRVRPDTWKTLCDLQQRTQLCMGTILEQCVNFALENMDGEIYE